VTFNQNNSYIFAVGGVTTLLGNVSVAGNGRVVFSGVVGDGGNGFGITYTGSSQAVLNAVNTYTGDTRVNAGTLGITAAGKIASGNVFVEPGAFLTLPSAAGWFSGGTQPKLFVNSSPTVLAEVQINYTGALPTLTSSAPAGGASAGVLALGSTVNINIAALGSNPAIVTDALCRPGHPGDQPRCRRRRLLLPRGRVQHHLQRHPDAVRHHLPARRRGCPTRPWAAAPCWPTTAARPASWSARRWPTARAT